MEGINSLYKCWLNTKLDNEKEEFKSIVDLHDFPDTGRGLKAMKEINESDLLLEIPARFILSALNIRFSPLFSELSSSYFPSWAFTGKIPDNDFEEPFSPYANTDLYQILHSPFLATILLLIYERHNPGSYWREMIDEMPLLEDHPIMWTEDQFKYLKNSSMEYKYVSHQINLFTKLYLDCFLPMFRLYPSIFDAGLYSVEDLRWAVASIWSRGYMLDDNDEFPGLVPIADMFNHLCSTEKVLAADYYLDMNTYMFKVYSKRKYSTGEQVFSTYGFKSNDEWLMNYGFVFKNNPEISIRIPVPEWKVYDRLKEQKKILMKSFILHLYPGNEPSTLRDLRIYFFDEIEREGYPDVIQDNLTSIDEMTPFSKGISYRNEKLVYSYILQYLKDIYSPSLQNTIEEEFDNVKIYSSEYFCLLFKEEEQRVLPMFIEEYTKLLEKVESEQQKYL